ncbi:MAG: NUDIX domain-containing protein [Balneolaceae bacterium]|nr:NUDIX domain-containing protein [Balneolaceae bacterium]
MSELVDLYPYRLISEPEFFLGRRSEDHQYAGQWRMVGGKVKRGEKAWEAALRELKEELNTTPRLFWSPPTLNQFYEPSSDRVLHIPVFAAELFSEQQITLNSEHITYQWVTIDRAEHYIQWPEQLRILKLIHNILRSKEIIDDWIIVDNP